MLQWWEYFDKTDMMLWDGEWCCSAVSTASAERNMAFRNALRNHPTAVLGDFFAMITLNLDVEIA